MNSRHSPGCHAQKRAKSRYGLRLFPWQLDALADEIHAGHALETLAESNSKWICLIIAGDHLMVAVYSRSLKRILTFLPQNGQAWQELEAKIANNKQSTQEEIVNGIVKTSITKARTWGKQDSIMVTAGQLVEGRRLMIDLVCHAEHMVKEADARERLSNLKARLDPENDCTDLVDWVEEYMARLMLKADQSYPFEALQNYLREEIRRAGLEANYPPGADLGGVVWSLAEANHFANILSLHPNPAVRDALMSSLKIARAWREEQRNTA